MTRSTQKNEEMVILRAIQHCSGINQDCCLEEGENPDFMLQIEGRTVGVEVTMFRSGRTVAGFGRRALSRRSVESEWERLEAASKEFRSHNTQVQNVYILFRFRGLVPQQREYQSFFQEILQFICSRPGSVTENFTSFGATDFMSPMSPLMSKYLKPSNGLTLRKSEEGEWDSNLTAGIVDGFPAQTISKIVVNKAAKIYRKADELWLVIGQSGRPSEMVLPIRGSDELGESLELRESLVLSPFSRVYVLTAMGLIWWSRDKGSWQLC